jgi:glyoxylase-like metal-dependent hydrolase (beta-lactamase superfamily II)
LDQITINRIIRNVYQLSAPRPSCQVYLIKSEKKNILIDTGIDVNFPSLEKALQELGLSVKDIHVIINTHEHFDHIGANKFFYDYSIIAASRSAATKIALQDKYVTRYEEFESETDTWEPHIWLRDRTRFDFVDFQFRILETPGHTSGCICIYEPFKKLLFSGDTVFASGTLSLIAPSGSAGDYINSIERLNDLKINLMLPGHGWISTSPEEDMKNAVINAKKKLQESRTRGGADKWTESIWADYVYNDKSTKG